MFVIVGRELVKDIIKLPYCHSERVPSCSKTQMIAYDTDFGGTSLGLWISHVGQGNVKATALNDEFLHYGAVNMYNGYDIHSRDVCNDYALYHKASAEQMFYLHVKYSDAASGTATSGKIFSANKIRSFDSSKLEKILEGMALTSGKTDVRSDARSCTTYAVVTTIFKSTNAVSDILKVR